ncbi:MAG: hypothetical protein AAGH79_02930 [Bacteroidota bacterium]
MKILLVGGLSLASMLYMMNKDNKSEYSSSTVLNTGVVSGYNITSGRSARIDNTFTSNELQNIINLAKSHQLREELCARVLAEILSIEKPTPHIINQENYNEMREILGDTIFQKYGVIGDAEKTYHNILKVRESNMEHPIYEILFSKNDYVGLEHMKSLSVIREGSSDMIRFSYKTTDPGITKLTLDIMIKEFVNLHKEVKEGQSTSVLEFFEESTRKAATRLRNAEDDLLAFRVDNKIINYYEQTRFISAKKEDLDEQYTAELMSLESADSTLAALEVQLTGRTDLPALYQLIAQERAKLSVISSEIARAEIYQIDTGIDTLKHALDILKFESKRLKQVINDKITESYAHTNTPEGLPLSMLLKEWLGSLLRMEEAEGRMSVMNRRKAEFEQIYSRFAPLGSKIKRIEREIDVAEREYLENLHSYNQARLHKYNMMISSNLKMVDPPYFPTEKAGGGAGIFAVIGFLAGFILPLAIIVALEFLDSTLKMPSRASKVTGLQIATAFPIFPKKRKRRFRLPWRFTKVNFGLVEQRILDQMAQVMHTETLDAPSNPKLIALVSSRKEEGKTFLMQKMAGYLRNYGKNVEVHRQSTTRKIVGDITETGSEEDNSHLSFREQTAKDHVDFVFFELPAILDQPFPFDQLPELDLVLMVARSNKVWNHGDKKALYLLEKAMRNTPFLVLNGCETDFLEEVIGEIPKRRSFIRRWVKKIVGVRVRA